MMEVGGGNGSHGGCGIWSIIGLEMKFGLVDV
jgi:hypothetical protein